MIGDAAIGNIPKGSCPHIPCSTSNTGTWIHSAASDEPKLLLAIFDILAHESRHSLCNMSLTNKTYHSLADKVLYKSLLFDRHV